MKKIGLGIFVLILLLVVSGHANSNKTVIVSFEEEKNLFVGTTLFVPTPENSSGKITVHFRDEKFEFVNITTSFSSSGEWSNVSFSFEKPYQNFLNSFVLQSVYVNFTNGGHREYLINKIINFENLNSVYLGEDIYVKNMTYNQSSGQVILDVVYLSNQESKFIEFFIRDLQMGSILVKKERPINRGNNTVSFFISPNLSEFFVEVDSSRKIFEFSEVNNVVFYPFIQKEFCGDGVDNNENLLIDENCYSHCPSSLPSNNSWHVVTCKQNSNWESKILDSLSNLSISQGSNVSIKKIFGEKTQLKIISSMPLQITSSKEMLNICSNQIFERNVIVEENESVEIFFKSTNESSLKLLSTPLQ